ncbi:MAG: SH3 domain-containing protein [Paracoccaceae bacterium]
MGYRAMMALMGAGLWAGLLAAGPGLAQEGKRPMPRPEGLVPAAAATTAPPASPDATATPALAAPSAPPARPSATAPAETAAAAPARDPSRGSVTNLPLPRFVSLKGNEGNARRGPGLTHRIDWVFTRSGMPLRITAEYENWRRVEDAEGVGGWVHYSLLSGVRSVLVAADLAEFHSRPQDEAEVILKAERNVVGWVQECLPDWCRVSVDGDRGWVRKTALWGVVPGEVIE